MVTRKQGNVEMVASVARSLGSLLDKVVFLGGATTSLLITDPAAPEIRGTLDVDVIVEIGSRTAYHKFGDKLVGLGFSHDTEEGAPICRWRIGEIKLDVMPTDAGIIGFSNRWYPEAMATARTAHLHDDLIIRIVSPPCFLATKMEAFRNRGGDDHAASHDVEDIVALLDGRAEIVAEVRAANHELRSYLTNGFRALMEDRRFTESISGHLPPDAASQARVQIVRSRLEQIADPD